jgi:hypothetical protein
MRIIDADLYAAELWKLRVNYQMLDDTHTADKIMHGIFRAEQALKEQPTVDAVPIVRCMKCRHAKQYSSDGAVFWCGKNNLIKYGVFFCADGESRS